MGNKIVRTGLRIPYDLNTWLILEAQKRGITKNALILQILWDWLERNDTPVIKDRIIDYGEEQK